MGLPFEYSWFLGSVFLLTLFLVGLTTLLDSEVEQWATHQLRKSSAMNRLDWAHPGEPGQRDAHLAICPS